MSGVARRRTLDAPGLISCGIGGRRRLAVRRIGLGCSRVITSPLIRGVAISVFSKIAAAVVAAGI